MISIFHEGTRMKYECTCSKGMVFFVILMIFFLAGCSGDSSEDAGTVSDPMALDIPALYSTVDTITVLVAHEPGAEPFTDSSPTGGPYWSVLKNNIEALFEGRAIEPDTYVPSTLSEMDRISDQEQYVWSPDAILALAREIWGGNQSSYEVEFFVLFLKGYYAVEGVPEHQIIGVSIVGTPVIAVFKDVVLSSDTPSQVFRYVEQATLVHEFGHVMGLVNNGVPMVSDHLDPDHPRHCTNDRCVMYWLNEGAADMMRFARQVIQNGSVVMFCDECLEDTQSYAP